MSVRVQTYVWQLTLSPTQKLVAIALADHCHDDGTEARPSQSLLAKKTGLSERTIRTALQELVRLDVLMVQRKSGQHSPNCYMFPIPDGFATLRGATVSGLSPEGQLTSQRGNSRRSEGQLSPPNHKEPSIETTAVNSSIQAKRAKEILRGVVDTEIAS